MGKKQIILLATSDINYDQRLQKVAASLFEQEYDVLLIGRQLDSSEPLQNTSFEQERVVCKFNKGMLFYLEINLRFFLRLRRRKIDLVCANDPDTLLAAILLNSFNERLFVYDSHEYFTEVPELNNKPIKKFIWSMLEKVGVNHASICYTVNESLAKIFQEKFNKKFLVVQNLPVLKPSLDLKTKKNYLLYQGALNEGRGLEVLIRSMLKIDMDLLIIGKGDVEEKLKSLVKKLNLTQKVTFKGMLLPEDLHQFTAEAKLGINLLESTSLNYYYSLANKYFDYMHAGIPTVNMNFPEYARIQKMGETGILINTLDEEEVVLAINSLLTNPMKYNELVRNCKSLAPQFTWENEEKKLVGIYSKLLMR